jgi:HEAT repeat protein
MDLEKFLNDKSIKPKEKTECISKQLLSSELTIDELIIQAKTYKDSPKATCIEALEFATKTNPQIATIECLNFVSTTLTEKAPRVKWESAKVIGNIAHLYPEKLDVAIANLLTNSEHSGTVVRWSTAFALGQIIKTKHSKTISLIPAIEAICEREEKNSIKKIYLDALKKAKK